jgi:hypothetical protein
MAVITDAVTIELLVYNKALVMSYVSILFFGTACPGESTQCKVETCILITAPWDAVPTRLPQVHHNATFKNKVYG